MSFLIILICVVLFTFFPTAFWLIFIAGCAGIAWFLIRKQEQALEAEEKQNNTGDGADVSSDKTDESASL